MVLLADRSIWSDETEMLARIFAFLQMWVFKKTIKWQRLLPERFEESATVSVIPEASTMKHITRGISAMLDGFAALVKKKKKR